MYAIRPGDNEIEHNWQCGNATDIATIAYSSDCSDTCGMWSCVTNLEKAAEGQTCFYYRRKFRFMNKNALE
jgi:hypothetical protein